MAKIKLKPPTQKDVFACCDSALLHSGIYYSPRRGHFVVSGELIPLKDVRMLLKHAIHANFFLTTADCYAMIHKFFETQKNKLDNRQTVGYMLFIANTRQGVNQMLNNREQFQEYVFDYYQQFPQDLGNGGAPSKKEIEIATAIRILFSPEFDGDSFDREKVRDVIIEMRKSR